MKQRITDYINTIEHLLEEKDSHADYDRIINRHLQEIMFFQHERLIHLIVTITFAILTLISVLIYVVSGILYLLPLIVLFFILLIPYIGHYYLLENGVQKMYVQYDKLLEMSQLVIIFNKRLRKK